MVRPVLRLAFLVVLRLATAAMVCGGGSSAYAQTPSWGMAAPHLVFSTYLGGGSPVCQGCAVRTFAQNAASDAWGNTYVTGATTVSDLATPFACQGEAAANSTLSAFVVKYDAYGRLLWCTYLGGNKQSMGVGVAVMPDGGVAVGGMTQSDASQPFPTLHAFQKQNNGKSDYFVSVFDAKGKLRYSTYLGGSEVDGEVDEFGNYVDNNTNGNNIAVDAHGLVYLTGTTQSRGGPAPAIKFPVTWNAIQPDMTGTDTTDAFLCILDPAKSGSASLLYCSFLGGSGNEKGHSVAVNATGSAIAVGGYTDSSDFPTTPNGYRSVPPPQFQSNGFVAQFRVAQHCPASAPCRYTMHYSTYLGGVSNQGGDSEGPRDDTYGVAIDWRGLILATGRTQSADFPMTPYGPSLYNSAPYLQPGTSNDQPYLVKIDPSLIGKASLTYSTFLGGGGFCTGVAVDPTGNAWVAGEDDVDSVEYTPSYYPVESPKLFPYTKNALIPSHLGAETVIHAILMGITRDGRRLSYSTYLSGTNEDHSYGLAVDDFGNVVVSGVTSSQDFPLKNPAQGWPAGSTQNAFVTKFSAY